MQQLNKPIRKKEIFDNLSFSINSDLSFEVKKLVDISPLDPDPGIQSTARNTILNSHDFKISSYHGLSFTESWI